MLTKFWKIFYLQQDEIHDTYNYKTQIHTFIRVYILEYTYNYNI